jgi:hypothetical protein
MRTDDGTTRAAYVVGSFVAECGAIVHIDPGECDREPL